MIKNIPLTTLKAFEASARLGSFRAAANELHLSASAMSHAIAKLERLLGTQLFERTTRNIILTQEGHKLFAHIEKAFEDIRIGLSLVSRNQPKLLRIHSAPSFAACNLLPKLSEFITQYPTLEVQIAASTNYARFSDDLFDFDIVYGELPKQDDIITLPLGLEVLTPLCAPSLASTIHKPQDLTRHKLIQCTSKRFSWNDWSIQNNILDLQLSNMSFDRSFLAIEAAKHGLGIILESTLLAHQDIKDGKLVAPLGIKKYSITYNGHYISYPKSTSKRNLIRNFINWIMPKMN